MGTQGPGRKRIPNQEKLTAEDDALNQIAREAEARLAAKRAARAEAREIRMKELEKQQKERVSQMVGWCLGGVGPQLSLLFHSHKKYYGLDNKWGHIEQWMEDSERYSRHSRRHASMSDDEEKMSVGSRGSFRVEERPDRDFVDKGSRTASTLSAATLASLGGASSRRGSCDTSFSVETEASIRDMKDSLAEVEEKYRKSMVSNAQLHNEKSTLMYQVETLREELSDMEELLWESRRHCDITSKELERERQAHSVLQFQFTEMRETLRQTDELLTEVSDLRLKSSSYCQEVSDLQEVLQWKEKKMAALERQKEISDIVLVERDGLRGEVVRLRDLLKKHGVEISLEVSTNGETGRGEDDVSTESVTRLAQEPTHGGRESMLGKVGEQQPAEGSKPPADDMRRDHCLIYKRLRSPNRTPSSKTKPETLKPAKRSEKQVGERRDRSQNRPGRTEGARKLPRNNGGEKETNKNFQIRQEINPSFRNEAVKKQPGAARKAAIARPAAGDPDFKGRTEPEASNQDKLLTHDSSDSHISITQLSLHPTENQFVDSVSVARRTSGEKVYRSRLVPPRPAKDMILDNKTVVSSLMAAAASCCHDGDSASSVSRQQREAASDITASVDRLREREHGDTMAEVEDEPSDGQRLEDTNILTDLVEKETVIMEKSSQTHKTDLSCCGKSEGRSFDLKMKPSELHDTITGGTSDPPEKIQNWRIDEADPVGEAVQVQDKSYERTECYDETETSVSSSPSPLVPVPVLKDWSALEQTIQSLLRGFVENQRFADEILRVFPAVPESLSQWISELEEKLKMITENVSDQPDAVNQEPTGLSRTPEDPEQSPAGPPAVITDRPVSGRSEAEEVVAQTNLSTNSGDVYVDVQDPSNVDQGVTGSTSDSMFCICDFQVEVTESSRDKSVDVKEVRQSEPMVPGCSEDFIVVESYFSECDLEGLVDSRNPDEEEDRQIVQGCHVSVEENVEEQQKIHRTLSTNSHAAQVSKIRRFIETTADEIKAMAVPELVLLSLQRGRTVDKSTWWTSEDLEEPSAEDVDSCEEVDEEATQQHGRPAAEVVIEDVKVIPVVSGVKFQRRCTGFSPDGRKDKHNSDCKIS
ncbi:uncharacterized protein lrrfip1b isoform X4 [Acanthopagrus latus]|uniref:uncharacterized protein lrrfip1b isoform X4 n=1 Tax=Acanthopagrus latus TaxID=8177 RepID=UPI00187CE227|nr:uncharacterized protein lrrfip1b isoform X4 [Acanthopagrus latus]